MFSGQAARVYYVRIARTLGSHEMRLLKSQKVLIEIESILPDKSDAPTPLALMQLKVALAKTSISRI